MILTVMFVILVAADSKHSILHCESLQYNRVVEEE